MASSTNEIITEDRLVRKSLYLQIIIQKLFTAKANKSLLAQKIVQLEKLIADLPNEHSLLANEWREKVVSFWVMYHNSKACGNPRSTVTVGVSPSDSDMSFCSVLSLSSTCAISSQTSDSITDDDDSSSTGGSSIRPYSALVRLQIEQIFYLMPSASDQFQMSTPNLKHFKVIESTKVLLEAVATAYRKVSESLPNNAQLMSFIFKLSFSKLSPACQHKYISLNYARKLKYLVRFLFGLIREHSRAISIESKRTIADIIANYPLMFKGCVVYYCTYCQSFGHLSSGGNCAQMMQNYLCFNCIERGHHRSECTNKQLFYF